MADAAEGQAGGARPPSEAALFTPVGSANAFEETLDRLLQVVKLGFVPPGSRLPAERDLAVRLGVSRQTIREAVRALVQAGYLDARRGRAGGTFVLDWPAPPSVSDARRLAREMGQDLHDALDLRRVVEPGAAELAAERADPAGLDLLAAAANVMDAAPRVTMPAAARARPEPGAFDPVPAGDVPVLSYRAADIRFHLAIAELSGAPSIVAAVRGLQMRLSDLLLATPQVAEVLRHSDEQHAVIVEAIRRGDGPAAREAMAAHVESTSTYLRAFLE